jgi:transglycosylase-like protein with SLT domain/LysM domain-containing protein
MLGSGFSLFRSIVLLLLFAAPAMAETAFPTEGLEARVEFWRNVYTQYGADDVVIHDRFYVNLVYAVANDETVDARVREVKKALTEIRDGIETPETLSETASPIYQAIVDQGLVPSESLLNDLLDGVHTQRGVKERFRSGVIKSGRYVDSFRKIMNDHDVPAEFALLPLVESSYENARSAAAAVGVWQFTRATARQYLQVRGRVDERLDPVKSAQAAAKLLRENYEKLGNWPLAITAYNHGRGGMLRAQSENGSNLATIISDYRGPVFGYASMNFYAEFVAAIDVYANYEQYFGTLALDRPLGQPAAKPVTTAASVQAAVSSPLAKASRPKTNSYTVRRGDTLAEIASQFRTSIRSLMQKNGLATPTIYAGQILLVR